MLETDPQTVRAAAGGDLEAFEELVRTYQQPLWRFLVGLVGDPSLAEDIAQDTFLLAFRRLDSFAFRSRFSTWLFQIARNRATDALRSRGRRHRLAEVLARRPTDPGPDPSLALALEEALGSLSRKLREAIVLVEVAGFSCKDAARILDVPEGTVKSRLYYARRELVAWFGGEEEATRDGV